MNTILRTMLVVACSALAMPAATMAQGTGSKAADISPSGPSLPPPATVKSTTPSQVAQAARVLRRNMSCETCGGDGVVVRQRTRKADRLFTKGEIYHEQDQCAICKGTGVGKSELILRRFDALVLSMAGCPDQLSRSTSATKVLTEAFDSISDFARSRNAESVQKAALRLAGGFGDEPGAPLVAIGTMQSPIDLGLEAPCMTMELPGGLLVALADLQYHSAKTGDLALGAGVVRGRASRGDKEYLVVDRGFVLMVTSEKDLKIQEEEAEAARRAAREPAPEPEPREAPRAPDDEEMPER
jgi:hypothetical protein